jgi:hypothetical protein
VIGVEVSPLVRRGVGIERFLRRPQVGRHVLEIDPDPRPRFESAAHRVDEHV